MGCCFSIKQFEHTENDNRQLKRVFSEKRRRSEACSRRNQNEAPEDKQNPVHQTYNFYYNGRPAEPYTVPEEGQDPRAPNLHVPMTLPLFTYQLQLESEKEKERETERENERETEREREIPELPPSPEPRTVYLRIKK
ncbi:E3 ubiquitin-protein ligase BRE1A-like [Saccostrea cucullata]|uniref:E3 ubiquitin-protein ligase BRE1A-like n=1 Tax=Saccostrea cuccullata TaxID=36930 RepID=UPI002ED0A62D